MKKIIVFLLVVVIALAVALTLVNNSLAKLDQENQALVKKNQEWGEKDKAADKRLDAALAKVRKETAAKVAEARAAAEAEAKKKTKAMRTSLAKLRNADISWELKFDKLEKKYMDEFDAHLKTKAKLADLKIKYDGLDDRFKKLAKAYADRGKTIADLRAGLGKATDLNTEYSKQVKKHKLLNYLLAAGAAGALLL